MGGHAPHAQIFMMVAYLGIKPTDETFQGFIKSLYIRCLFQGDVLKVSFDRVHYWNSSKKHSPVRDRQVYRPHVLIFLHSPLAINLG